MRDVQVGDLADVIALDHLQACQFLGASHKAFGGETEQVGQADTDQGRDGGGEQQGADGQEVDLAQGRGVMQPGHGAENRGEDQRDHDHLQQLYVTVAHQVEPADGGFEHRAAGAMDRVQGYPEPHPEQQRQQHLFRQAPVAVTGLRQAEQQGEEHQQIEEQRQIHQKELR